MEETTQAPVVQRGACTGCKSKYQLSTARSGEFKGKQVVRKHLSRTAQGECEGSRKPPRVEHTEGCTENETAGVGTVADSISDLFADPLPFEKKQAPVIDFADPAPVADVAAGRGPWCRASFDSPCAGSCGCDVLVGEEIRSDGEGGWLCENCGRDENTTTREVLELVQRPAPVDEFADPAPFEHTVTVANGVISAGPSHVDDFADPSPMPAELPPVHGQPEPDRDRWGRYKIFGTSHTRATTFAKAASSTHALSEWRERMVVLGLSQRRDLLAMAHGLHVKQDRKTLNDIASQAKDAAGVKVAANIGTAYHAFSERLDAGLMKLSEVPEEYRARMAEYVATIHAHGLTTRPEWIERTTAVRADQVSAQVPVAGTLDRIFQLPNGELVIGDLKTGSDLSYGWGEIAVQLALYAQGVNTRGLFDWNTKTWERIRLEHGGPYVRSDYGIVIHLPADGQGCTIYRVDLAKGWERAQVCGQVMSMQKEKDGLAIPLTAPLNPAPIVEAPVHVSTPESPWEKALRLFRDVASKEEAARLYEFAATSGQFHQHQLSTLIGEARTALQRQGITV